MVRARRNPYYPAWTKNTRRKSEQDDRRRRLCEEEPGVHQAQNQAASSAPTSQQSELQPTATREGSRGDAQPKRGAAVSRSAGEPAGKRGLGL